MSQWPLDQTCIYHASSCANFSQRKNTAKQPSAVFNEYRYTVPTSDTLAFKTVGILVGQGIKLTPCELLIAADNRGFVGILGGSILKHQTEGCFGII